MKIVAVIPAHMASVRFPGKILFPFHGLPMIEHVRRRALLSQAITDVIVATCDEDIASVILGFGGKVVMTADTHKNGTTRVAEAVKDVDCTHVILLQGDEPLLLPRHVRALAAAMRAQPVVPAWNLVAAVTEADEMDRHSFVKCAVAQPDRILYCFRRSPYFSSFSQHREYARKILGIIAYRRDFLLQLTALPSSPAEKAESIEQMRILDNGFPFHYVEVAPSLPSINEPHELNEVLASFQSDAEQQALLAKILAQPSKN